MDTLIKNNRHRNKYLYFKKYLEYIKVKTSSHFSEIQKPDWFVNKRGKLIGT